MDVHQEATVPTIFHCLQKQASGNRTFQSVFQDCEEDELAAVPPTEKDVCDGMGRMLHEAVLHRAPINTTNNVRFTLYASSARSHPSGHSVDHAHTFPLLRTKRPADGENPMTEKQAEKLLHDHRFRNNPKNFRAFDEDMLVRRKFLSAALRAIR
jgi:hypothetical protein